ncbi:MAG: penicillin-binding protein activator LpoB [Sedimentisphaerales bacterium]|nr:penicillin-binding protein activator LpoB [Sedimentisphaerales bacterium]
MKTKLFSIILFAGLLIAGCGEPATTNIDTTNDSAGAVMSLDYRDFDQAASKMVQSLLGSGRLGKSDGSRYVLATGRILNNTTQRIDTDQLMLKVRREITNSGQGVFSAVVGPGSDKTLLETRELRESDEFDTSTTAEKRTLIAPELTIQGKIHQVIVPLARNRQQVEYYFQLELSEVKTGLTYWQEEVLVGKRGSDKSVPW